MKFCIKGLLLSLTFLTIISCSKTTFFNTDRARALKNGKSWSSDQNPFFVRSNIPDTIKLHFFSADRKLQAEQFNFVNIPLKEGTYKLENLNKSNIVKNTPTVSLTYIDYDVVTQIYALDSSVVDHFFTIDEISNDSTNIKGSFSASFVLDEFYSGPPSEDSPKVIEFSIGRYKSKEGW